MSNAKPTKYFIKFFNLRDEDQGDQITKGPFATLPWIAWNELYVDEGYCVAWATREHRWVVGGYEDAIPDGFTDVKITTSLNG